MSNPKDEECRAMSLKQLEEAVELGSRRALKELVRRCQEYKERFEDSYYEGMGEDT